jgi:Bifunctional DNA primase/polymerase, N-terminal
MPDLLPYAMRYKVQSFWPLPTIEDLNKPDRRWKALQSRQLTAQEMHEAWPPKGNANVALVCGPAAHVLVLNVNVKNGADGRMLLQQRGLEIPRTPEMITPSGGAAYLFKVPDIRSPFRLHNYPKGWKGIELRGAGAIQVMPPSRLKHGVYRFADGWTLERLIVDLGDMPDWLLELWITLDRGRNVARDEPATTGHARESASALALPADFSTPSSPSPPQSHAPPVPRATATAKDLTTITTTLSPDDYSDFEAGEVEIQDRECAEHLSRRFGLEAARLDDGQSMLCVLPGHRERTPSATWFKTNSGHYIYHDWHARSGDAYYPVPDVFAALVTGKTRSLPKPSRKTWRLRLMVEAGLLDPYLVEMKPFPDDMPALLRHFCDGFRYLCACKWTYQERAPTMFTDEFAAGWCGIREGSIWKLRRVALAHGFMVAARDDQGRLVYLPGKEE